MPQPPNLGGLQCRAQPLNVWRNGHGVALVVTANPLACPQIRDDRAMPVPRLDGQPEAEVYQPFFRFKPWRLDAIGDDTGALRRHQ